MATSDLITLRMGALSVRDKISEKAHVLVDTTAALKSALDDMRHDKVFALDCEGVGLSRHGKLTLVQIASKTSNNVWVIDVTKLGSLAFKTASRAGDTVQSILEDTSILKVALKGIYDLQLAEALMRRKQGHAVRFVTGFGKVLSVHCPEADSEVGKLKTRVSALFEDDPSIWDRRPLPSDMIEYAANDVQYLLRIYDTLSVKLYKAETEKVLAASIVRVNECRRHPTPTQGRHRAMVPRI